MSVDSPLGNNRKGFSYQEIGGPVTRGRACVCYGLDKNPLPDPLLPQNGEIGAGQSTLVPGSTEKKSQQCSALWAGSLTAGALTAIFFAPQVRIDSPGLLRRPFPASEDPLLTVSKVTSAPRAFCFMGVGLLGSDCN
jgi:hypothetical protein